MSKKHDSFAVYINNFFGFDAEGEPDAPRQLTTADSFNYSIEYEKLYIDYIGADNSLKDSANNNTSNISIDAFFQGKSVFDVLNLYYVTPSNVESFGWTNLMYNYYHKITNLDGDSNTNIRRYSIYLAQGNGDITNGVVTNVLAFGDCALDTLSLSAQAGDFAKISVSYNGLTTHSLIPTLSSGRYRIPNSSAYQTESTTFEFDPPTSVSGKLVKRGGIKLYSVNLSNILSPSSVNNFFGMIKRNYNMPEDGFLPEGASQSSIDIESFSINITNNWEDKRVVGQHFPVESYIKSCNYNLSIVGYASSFEEYSFDDYLNQADGNYFVITLEPCNSDEITAFCIFNADFNKMSSDISNGIVKVEYNFTGKFYPHEHNKTSSINGVSILNLQRP